jgi:hypothetical protein
MKWYLDLHLWYLDVLKKYAVFSGRARRKEYWGNLSRPWDVGQIAFLKCVYPTEKFPIGRMCPDPLYCMPEIRRSKREDPDPPCCENLLRVDCLVDTAQRLAYTLRKSHSRDTGLITKLQIVLTQ